MIITLSFVVATFVLVLVLALLWRRECHRQGVKVKPHVFWFPALVGLVAVISFVGFGMQKGAYQLVSDFHDYAPQAQKLIDGEPLNSLNGEQLPLFGLIHALQDKLMRDPTAAGWDALSKLYRQLTEETELDASEVAVAAAENAFALDPDNVDAKMWLAQTVIMANGGALNARSKLLIEGVLKQNPDYDGAWLMMAMAAVQGRQYDDAERAFSEMLRRHSDDRATALLERSLEHVRSEKQKQQHFSTIRITVDAADDVVMGGTLFVSVQKKGGAGMPLAAKRLLLDHVPTTVVLTPADWLAEMPAADEQLVATARYGSGAVSGVDEAQNRAETAVVQGDNGLSAMLTLTQ